MKKNIFKTGLSICALAFFIACSNENEINTDWNNEPIEGVAVVDGTLRFDSQEKLHL